MTDDPKALRESDDPKCANCAHWAGEFHHSGNMCTHHMTFTLDLDLCSDWEKK